MERYNAIIEADRKMKKEKEKKKREHEEELFQIDLQRAYDAEYAQGEIAAKKKMDKKEVENKIKEYEEKIKKNNDYRTRTGEEFQHRMNEKNVIRQKKAFIALNKDQMISEEDFSTYVPKHRQQSSRVENTNGYLVNKPSYLSNFTIDREKIDFFKKAQDFKNKIQKSEKLRENQLKDQAREIKRRVEEKQA